MKKTVLTLSTTRSGYSLQQIIDSYTTLTVGELKEILDQYDDDTPIAFVNDNKYTYGHIFDYFFDTEEVDIYPNIKLGDEYKVEGYANIIFDDVEYDGFVSTHVKILDEPDEAGWVRCLVYDIDGEGTNVETFVDVDELIEI